MIHLAASFKLIIILGNLIKWTSGEFYSRPGVSAAEIMRARGYEAQDYRFISPDGYRIRLTRGTNPLINNGRSGLATRDPILFVHGILEDSGVFVINSNQLEGPKDFSRLNLSDSQVVSRIAREASAKSLPFLAMDFGHEVWMMNRRGFPGSQDKVRRLGRGQRELLLVPEEEASRVDQYEEQYYDDYDDQGDLADRDYDEDDYHLDDFIELDDDVDGDGDLFESFFKDYRDDDNTKNNVKGDGQMISKSGGQLRFSLLPFLQLPNAFFQNGKLIENIIFSFDRGFWSFSLDQQAKFDLPLAIGHVLNVTGRPRLATATHSAGGGLLLMALSLYPELADRLAANVMWSPAFTLGRAEGLGKLQLVRRFLERKVGPIPPVWATPPIQGLLGSVCNLPLAPRALCEWFNDFLNGDSGGRQPMYPEFTSTQFYPTSSREVAQFLQTQQRGGSMHFYDYGPRRNRLLYGNKSEPPPYELGRVKSKTISIYSTPTDGLIRPEDISKLQSLMTVASKSHIIRPNFNHVGYFFHEDNARMAIIPALRDIHNLAA